MSWTEPTALGALPLGALQAKAEATEVPGGPEDGLDGEEDYRDFVRGEAVAWGPDRPFLAADEPREAGGRLARERLNLRFRGSRGSAGLPSHPELFLGFTGNDPRGADNTPRFDRLRALEASRARGYVPRMGDNNDEHLADRPWTAQAEQAGRQARLRWAKRHRRVFARGREAAPAHRGAVAPEAGALGALRAAVGAGAGEGFAPLGAPTAAGKGGAPGRAPGGPPADWAPWRNAGGDAPLGVQRFAPAPGGGAPMGAGPGGARFGARPEAAWGAAPLPAGARRALAASMAVAAAAQGRFGARPDAAWGAAQLGAGPAGGAPLGPGPAAARFGARPGAAWGAPREAAAPGAGAAPSAEVTALYAAARFEGAWGRDRAGAPGPAGAPPMAAGGLAAGRRGGAAALAPPAAAEVAVAAAAGVRLGSGRPVREGLVAAARGGEQEGGRAAGGRAPPGAAAAARAGRAALAGVTRAAAAEGLVVHVYRPAAPVAGGAPLAALAAAGADPAAWRDAGGDAPRGRAKGPESLELPGAGGVLGVAPAAAFGRDDGARAAGGVGRGTARRDLLRPGAASTEAPLEGLSQG
jgi:hypothetical protein